jgi:hypothetical protein
MSALEPGAPLPPIPDVSLRAGFRSPRQTNAAPHRGLESLIRERDHHPAPARDGIRQPWSSPQAGLLALGKCRQSVQGTSANGPRRPPAGAIRMGAVHSP